MFFSFVLFLCGIARSEYVSLLCLVYMFYSTLYGGVVLNRVVAWYKVDVVNFLY